MALDTLTRVLKVDCCWIQTISDRRHKKLLLTAERGFSPEIRQEILSMDLSHSFSQQVIGLGEKIIIPDLCNDGLYGLPSFRATGFKWLVAVPLMTYRVHGILGTASRKRKLLEKETADLFIVIAGLIATSLNKAQLIHQAPVLKKRLKEASPEKTPDTPPEKPETPSDSKITENTTHPKTARRSDSVFNAHARKMETFRRSHR